MDIRVYNSLTNKVEKFEGKEVYSHECFKVFFDYQEAMAQRFGDDD